MNVIIQFMKRNYKLLLLVGAIAFALYSFMPKTVKTDPEKDKTLLE